MNGKRSGSVEPAQQQPQPPAGVQPDRARQVHHRVTMLLQALLLIGAVIAAWQGNWQAAITTGAILVVTLFPLFLERRLNVFIPPEIEVVTVLFIFASLFLGEVRGYYARFAWWDIALHVSSGFLLGIFGFLLVYVWNEKEEIELDMKPSFVAFFAFMFSVGLGALWEIFEFSMDLGFGLNMQKSGLVDTMSDLIVDTIGALVIAVLGYGYLRTAGTESFLEQWILRFIEANPHLFRDGRAESGE